MGRGPEPVGEETASKNIKCTAVEVPAAKCDNLSLICRSHVEEGQNQLLKSCPWNTPCVHVRTHVGVRIHMQSQWGTNMHLSVSWMHMQCDRLPLAPAAVLSLPETPQTTTKINPSFLELLLTKYLVTAKRKVTNTNWMSSYKQNTY